MTTVTYTIPTISCGHCVHTIQSEVSELAGVKSVVAHQDSKQATITFDAPATEDGIIALLKEIGYAPGTTPAGQDLIQLN
ncbi:MAG: heavy-metal-associated domain-containing protein [Anaerolineales bacterium]